MSDPHPDGLSAFDDFLIHQVPEPVRHLATSDRNFYDRHYFNAHAGDDSFFLILGLGQYPNRGTQDAFVTVRVGDRQTTLRSSRRLADRSDMSCGPIRVEVLEGLKRLRLTIGPNDSGIEADLVFVGDHSPRLEPRQIMRRNGRVIHDVMRYCQSACYEGWLSLGERRWASGDTPLRGYRDRSWGIRPIGRPESADEAPVGDRAVSGLFGTTDFRRLHMSCRFEGFSINIKLHEDGAGRRALEEAIRLWHDGRPPESLGRPYWENLRFSADRRFIEQADVRFVQEGMPDKVLAIRQLLPVYLEAGTGYGNRTLLKWIHGQYRGEEVTDVATFDLNRRDPVLAGPIDCLAEMAFEGQRGEGLFEYTLFGRTDGFTGQGHFNEWPQAAAKE
ncbi:MAG: hypothetical protein M0R28_15485 [Pigmentiphaga sp.]|nr:hypothetical protein [Pigmentiphaga sp.]